MTKIYITTASKKSELLTKLSKEKPFENRKIYTIEEFAKIYPYEWNLEALDYIITKYEVILDVAKIYLDQIIKYPIEKLQEEKRTFLQELKNDLITKQYLKENKQIITYLEQGEIIVDLEPTKGLIEYFKNLPSVSFKTIETKNYNPTIYELSTIEEEITFVGEQIGKLINSGVNPNNIYISNLDNSYHHPIKRITKMLNIPFELTNQKTINQTRIGCLFLKNYQENIENALNLIKEEVKTKEEYAIYNEIIKTINKYNFLKNCKMFITNELSTKKGPRDEFENTIREIDFQNKTFTEKEYLFILNCNAFAFPKVYKDEDYLSDKEKKSIGIDTSSELNKKEKETTIAKIKNIPHVVMTYKTKIGEKEYYPSPLLEELAPVQKNNELTFNLSDEYNKIYLASELDEYIKYNTISKELTKIENSYKIPYRTYNNNFTGLNTWHIEKLTLSYTALDTYLKCPFRYYLTYILKILPYQETFSLFIGNLFHKTLEIAFSDNNNWESFYDSEVTKRNKTFKEQFFLTKLKGDLQKIISIIKEQMTYTELQTIETEKTISCELTEDFKITFTGKIDKILKKTKEENEIMVIIDYKTGSFITKEEYLPLGFHLQLPLYLYLAKKGFGENTIIGGIYTQEIIPSRIQHDNKYTLEYLEKKALKLNGYSTNNQDILQLIDSSYKESHIINGLKIKNDGEFYHYAKVLDEDDFISLFNLAENHIKKAAHKIKNGEFPMESKIIDNKEHISCNFCPLKDICYHTPKENIYLESDKTYLKKEEKNGMDERTRTSNS